MSERNIERMIQDLESGDKRTDFKKKSQEIKDFLENKEVTEFLKVYAAIELAVINDQTSLVKTSDLSDRLYELAHERLEEYHFEYFDRMTIELQKAERIQRYLRLDARSLYESYISEGIKFPTLKQFEKCSTSGFDHFLLIPKVEFDNLQLRLIEGLDLIKGEMLFPLYIDPDQHQGNSKYEIIALQRFMTKASDGIGSKSGFNNPRDKKHFEWRRAVDEHLVLDQDETMSLQGLTLKEYLIMQLVYLNERIKINEGMVQPLSEIQLLDNLHSSNAAILTGSWRNDNDGKNGEFLSARWDETTRQLMINPPSSGKTMYIPWYAIHFDKIKDSVNESGA